MKPKFSSEPERSVHHEPLRPEHSTRTSIVSQKVMQSTESVCNNALGYGDLLTKIPLGNIGTPSGVAGMAVALASDVASYGTGTTIIDYPNFSHEGERGRQ